MTASCDQVIEWQRRCQSLDSLLAMASQGKRVRLLCVFNRIHFYILHPDSIGYYPGTIERVSWNSIMPLQLSSTSNKSKAANLFNAQHFRLTLVKVSFLPFLAWKMPFGAIHLESQPLTHIHSRLSLHLALLFANQLTCFSCVQPPIQIGHTDIRDRGWSRLSC